MLEKNNTVSLFLLTTIFVQVFALNGCEKNGTGGESNTNDVDSDMKYELKPGEVMRITIPATSNELAVGIECVDPLGGGLIKLQQVDVVSQISTSNWASRKWVTDKENFEFELINNTQSEATVRVFIGERP